MLALLALIPMLFCAPHGGQYIPPLPVPDTPEALDGVVAQPGLGPEIAFSAYRWEWWYDFNQEPLLDLRRRMADRARVTGAVYEPVTAADRAGIVLPALVDALRKREPTPGIRRDINSRDVRSAAVLSLGRLELAEAVPYIELVVESDPDLFVRTQAILALGFSRSPQAVENLVRLFTEERVGEELRTYAAVGLALISNTEAVDTLREALTEKSLKDMTNQLRAATIYAAGISGQAELGVSLRALAETWMFGQNPDVRALVAISLGRIDDPASVPFLLTQLADPDNQVRRSAAAALIASSARLDAGSVEAMIEHFSKDADQNTRLNLARALGAARLPESRAFLRETLPTATYEYRPHVALGLALDGDPANGKLLLAALKAEKDLSVSSALAFSLGLLEDADATEPLLEMLAEQRDPMTRGYLCLALGLINPPQPDLGDRLKELALGSHDVELGRSALIGLGLAGARAQIDAIAAGIATVKSPVDRATLIHGLGLAGDRRVLPALLAVLQDESQPNYVRTYALQAIGELCDPRDLSPCWLLSSHVELSHEVGFLFELYRVL